MIERVVLCINKLLEINIPVDILGSAWSKLSEIGEHCDESKEDPDKVILIPLVEHEINSQHNPNIKLFLEDDIAIGRIDFHIDVTLKVEGVILEIRDRKIQRFTLGKCIGTGTLSCSGIPIVERVSEPLKLSGWIDLDKGIPLCKTIESNKEADANGSVSD